MFNILNMQMLQKSEVTLFRMFYEFLEQKQIQPNSSSHDLSAFLIHLSHTEVRGFSYMLGWLTKSGWTIQI
jgi:hypothetical protein